LSTTTADAVILPVRSTKDTPLSADEKALIRSLGLAKTQRVPQQNVEAEYLFHEHRKELAHTLGYIRKREELREYWRGWWKEHKTKGV
jgi:hypothetical protein